MSDEFLIKNTTREQRENCSSCDLFGTGDAFEMYRPYIDGLKELSEISHGFRASYLK